MMRSLLRTVRADTAGGHSALVFLFLNVTGAAVTCARRVARIHRAGPQLAFSFLSYPLDCRDETEWRRGGDERNKEIRG
jgi:hypothetical protein